MNFEKENFLRTRFISILQQMDPGSIPRWGKMNVQQMVEHIADMLRWANGKIKFDTIHTPPEKLRSYREFLMSDKPFKENTKNPFLAEQPGPVRHKTVQAAIGELHEEVIIFFEVFERDPQLVIRNPIFGDLNFEQSIQLLYKHSLHHLKQFGVEPLST
ncbi:MAG: hypothetical protein JST17_05095 [Bacteroidetes bacterium]|nr:hypothetical protein [Bacteroidota bacterium]MBS1932036.1 hypothetical protein [Bacteroidota bacterium]